MTITTQEPVACPPGPPRKSLKNQLVSGVVFPSILGPNMGFKMAQNWSPRGPQGALGATLLLEAVFGAMLGSFLVPRNLENRAPAAAGARFSEIKPLVWGSQNRTQNRPKIEPQTTPRGTKMAKKLNPNRCSFLNLIASPNSTIFGP